MTALQRFSAMNISAPWRGLNVVPQATNDADERLAAMYFYAGIPVAAPVESVDGVRFVRRHRPKRKPDPEPVLVAPPVEVPVMMLDDEEPVDWMDRDRERQRRLRMRRQEQDLIDMGVL